MNDLYSITMLVSIMTLILTMHITPGPTNILLLSSVINFGYKKSLPFMIANIISYLAMAILIALGLGIFLINHPKFFLLLKILGVIYLTWMAWKIANNKEVIETKDKSINNKPFNFWQSFIYPLLNPKAWIAYSIMIPVFISSAENFFFQVSFICVLIFIALLINTFIWTFCGILLKQFLKEQRYIKRVNQVMALLLIASIIPLLI